MNPLSTFLTARNQLLALREDLPRAQREFRWPRLEQFNWAADYFDSVARGNEQPALRVVDDLGCDLRISFAQLSRRSNQVANLLRKLGISPGDRVLLMLGNTVPLWETMLALIK